MSRTEELTKNIVEFYEKLSSWETSVVRDKGITLQQMHTLEILGISGPLRMKELAGKIGVTTGTLTVMVDRLEKNGHVARKPHEKDRRSILVELTAQGAKISKEHHELHNGLTREIVSGLNDEEQEALSLLLTKMNREF